MNTIYQLTSPVMNASGVVLEYNTISAIVAMSAALAVIEK